MKKSRDSRVEALVRAASDDLQPHVDALRAQGWPVHARVDVTPGPEAKYTVSLVITVIPVSVSLPDSPPDFVAGAATRKE